MQDLFQDELLSILLIVFFDFLRNLLVSNGFLFLLIFFFFFIFNLFLLIWQVIFVFFGLLSDCGDAFCEILKHGFSVVVYNNVQLFCLVCNLFHEFLRVFGIFFELFLLGKDMTMLVFAFDAEIIFVGNRWIIFKASFMVNVSTNEGYY